jgi:hypothetical protein
MKFQLKRNEMQIGAKVLKIFSSSFMAMVLEKNNFQKTQIRKTPFLFKNNYVTNFKLILSKGQLMKLKVVLPK